MTRNERRKAAKKRLEAKQERFLGRVEAQRLENVRAIVKSNLNSPKPERSHLRSCLAGVDGQTHNGYVCRPAKGSVDTRAKSISRSMAQPKPVWQSYQIVGMDKALDSLNKAR